MKKALLLLISLLILSYSYAQRSLKINVGGKFIRRLYFNKAGLLKREIAYNLLNKQSDTIYYTYKGARLANVSIRGKGNVVGRDKNSIIKSAKDLENQIKILSKLKIIVPFTEGNKDIISDIANILLIPDIRKEKREGNKRIISIDSINTNIQFHPSDAEYLAPQITRLKSYELTLKNNTIYYETYVTDSTVLYRSYFYKNKRLTMIVSEGRYKEHGESLSIKGFH